jgi:hypothetical protein
MQSNLSGNTLKLDFCFTRPSFCSAPAVIFAEAFVTYRAATVLLRELLLMPRLLLPGLQLRLFCLLLLLEGLILLSAIETDACLADAIAVAVATMGRVAEVVAATAANCCSISCWCCCC